MDRTLETLRRAHEADPSDEEAARAYVAALQRAGEDDAVERLYAFKFKCDVNWWQLPLANPGGAERHCDRCERSVHFVRSRDQLEERVKAGDCVAFAPSQLDALAFLVDDAGLHPGHEQGALCLVEGEAPIPPPSLPMAGAPMPIPPPSSSLVGGPMPISPPSPPPLAGGPLPIPPPPPPAPPPPSGL